MKELEEILKRRGIDFVSAPDGFVIKELLKINHNGVGTYQVFHEGDIVHVTKDAEDAVDFTSPYI